MFLVPRRLFEWPRRGEVAQHARGTKRILIGIFAIFCVVLWASHANADPTVHLRIAWGGSAERQRQWQGSVSLDRGTLEIERPLGSEADEPGSMWIEGGALEINERSSRLYDGVDVIVTAPADAMLALKFRDAQDPATLVETSAPLAEIVGKSADNPGKPLVKELDKNKNRLLVRRTPGDLLRVALKDDRLVFAPGDTFKFDVEPRMLPVPTGTSLTLRARLVTPNGGKEWSTQEQTFKTTVEDSQPGSIPLEFKLPAVEGVYDIVLEALEPPALRWNKAKQIAERHVQLLVIGDQRPAGGDANAPWTHVMEIDPANPKWFERIKTLTLIPGLSQGTLSNGNLQTTQHELGTLVQLSATTAPQDPQWQAYPLSIARPGAPHIVEVEYPSDVPQTLGISIVEPNAAGWVLPVELDSGVYSSEQPSTGAAKLLKHRLLFWPRTKTPLLLITNRREGARAEYGKIRVLAGPSRLPRAPFVNGFLPERLIAGFNSRPLVPENFARRKPLMPGADAALPIGKRSTMAPRD